MYNRKNALKMHVYNYKTKKFRENKFIYWVELLDKIIDAKSISNILYLEIRWYAKLESFRLNILSFYLLYIPNIKNICINLIASTLIQNLVLDCTL